MQLHKNFLSALLLQAFLQLWNGIKISLKIYFKKKGDSFEPPFHLLVIVKAYFTRFILRVSLTLALLRV
jgi:hypothetical protein